MFYTFNSLRRPFALVPLSSAFTISPLTLPKTFNGAAALSLRFTVRRSARRASRILALSEHARSDIIETYGIAPELVTAVPLAAANAFRPVDDTNELQRIRHTYGIEREYILSVGSVQPRKNLQRLIAAYASLKRTRASGSLPQLVIVGKLAWLYDETLRAVEALGSNSSVIVTGYVPRDDLPALYSGALCFVYPSYFEGFGLPPLEAMKCGVPVIAGNKASLPEVVGDAGLLVDPFDVDAIAAAIASLIDNPTLDLSYGSRV